MDLLAGATNYGRTTGTSTFSWDDLYINVTSIPDTGYGYFQILSLLFIYFALLWFSSYLIVSGTELLIFIPGFSSIVGSIILPVMGQIPMILLSIFAGFGADAQEELEVGVGALAGALVGQVSIYGFLSILLGAVNIDPTTGLTDYSKKSKKRQPETLAEYWLLTGIKSGKYTKTSTIYILVTAFPFVIMLIPNIMYANDRVRDLTAEEQGYDIFAFVFAFVLFLVFSAHQYAIMSTNSDLPYFDVKDQIMVNSVRKKLASLMGLLSQEVHDAEDEEARINRALSSASLASSRDSPMPTQSPSEQSPLFPKPVNESMRQLKIKLERIVTPFFPLEAVVAQEISMTDLLSLFHEIGERHVTLHQLKTIFKTYIDEEKDTASTHSDLPRSGSRALLGVNRYMELGRKHDADFPSKVISIDNVVDGLAKFLTHYKEYNSDVQAPSVDHDANPIQHILEDMGEFPQDLSDMSNDDQQFYLRLRASLLLIGGLLLSIYAVDPIILCLEEFSSRVVSTLGRYNHY